jgi:hypothetical protein
MFQHHVWWCLGGGYADAHRPDVISQEVCRSILLYTGEASQDRTQRRARNRNRHHPGARVSLGTWNLQKFSPKIHMHCWVRVTLGSLLDGRKSSR